ncbi:bifunctional riboflavin kinase/FAD synthetase [Campylobacter devanensis]|uniref:bifunctional riboflavin kinase/FAD synthetase n=1 Tax=Campylobacter devanensis TaxID=3161138 RepID=UPI000A34E12B|nr:bifunctional riboflavin kinase/FAD synthetase [Campylobacter sp. P0106]
MLNYSTISKSSIKSVAIGSFDGIHKGHKELIKKLGDGGALVVICNGRACLTPGDRRQEYSGVPCFYYDLDDISELRGDEFIDMLKKDFVNLKKIVVGYDFKFGKDRAWDKHDLKHLFDGEVVVVDEFCFDGLGVHSSAIRRFLRDGDIYRANRLLGREYSVVGKVIAGQGIGKKYLYPTLNLDITPYIVPKNGVYATRTKIDENTYSSITFVGYRLSTDGKFAIENHILDNDIDITPSSVRVCFVEWIRDNKKFDSLDELKNQIAKDIVIAKNVAKSCDLSIDEISLHSRNLEGVYK